MAQQNVAALTATDQDGCAAATGASKPAVEAHGLSVEIAGHRVLDEIDLRLERRQIVAVLGANGAGKTTLLKCLAGLARPTSGELRWFGQSLRRNQLLRRSIGLVAHQRFLYGELTSRENLLFAARMCDVPEPTTRVAQLLAEAGMERHAELPTARLSHGLRQRLAVCRALVAAPSVLLLDEPFSGLDDEGKSWLRKLLHDLQRRHTAICITLHEQEIARRLADRVLRLEGGKLRDLTEPSQATTTERKFRRVDAA